MKRYAFWSAPRQRRFLSPNVRNKASLTLHSTAPIQSGTVVPHSKTLARVCGLLVFFASVLSACAHELRPAYLALREEQPGEFSVLWKTPMLGDARLALAPEFSGDATPATPVTTSRTPEWYNTLEDNCTTGVLHRTEAYKGRGRYNWKILLPGYAAEYAYDIGMLDTSMPFADLSQRCLVNPKAEAADKAEDFSLRIREGLPLPTPMTMQELQSGR